MNTDNSAEESEGRRAASRAVFLDRDGTMVVDKEYMSDPEQLEWLENVPEAMSRLKEAGFELIVVTNQSGVARGYFGEAAVEATNNRLRKMMRDCGVAPKGIYYCPAHPEAEDSKYRQGLDRRKPAPGMLVEAAREHGLQLNDSFMVGDKLSDVEAGNRAGCRSVLVGTGKESKPDGDRRGDYNTEPDFVAPDLLEAAEWIVKTARE